MSATEQGITVRAIAQAGEPGWYMYVRCAWCGSEIGTKPCAPRQHLEVSHGICLKCARDQEELAREARLPVAQAQEVAS